jgi:uncharacterized membrane protein
MKRFFAKGLYALLPLLLTIAVLYLVVGFIFDQVGVPMGDLLRVTIRAALGSTEEEIRADPHWNWFYGKKEGERGFAPYAGFVLGIVIVFFLGVALATFIGDRLFRFFEWIIGKIPLIREIYPYAKQFTGFFAGSEGKIEFKTVVAVPFPTKGIYSLGFVTAEGLRTIAEAEKKAFMTVFIPTSPTPMSGFVVYVPREEIIPIPISVEEAMRIIISCGVLSPTHQSVDILGGRSGGASAAATLGEKPGG